MSDQMSFIGYVSLLLHFVFIYGQLTCPLGILDEFWNCESKMSASSTDVLLVI